MNQKSLVTRVKLPSWFNCYRLPKYSNDSFWHHSHVWLDEQFKMRCHMPRCKHDSPVILSDLSIFSNNSQTNHSGAILELGMWWYTNDQDNVSVCHIQVMEWNWLLRIKKSLVSRIKWPSFVIDIIEMGLNDQDNAFICSIEGDGTGC